MEFGIRLSNVQSDWERMRSFTRLAEQAGFDAVQVSDHLLAPTDHRRGVLEGWTVTSALCQMTTRLDVSMVICQGFRSPALLAKMITAIDHVSNGRFRMILGTGYHESEFRSFGYRFPPAGERVGHFEEAVQVLRALLDSEGEPVDFHGSYLELEGARNLPKPLRRIPIAVGGTRPRMLRIAAQYADEWNVSSGNVTNYRSLRNDMQGQLERFGRNLRRSVSVTFSPGTVVEDGVLDCVGGSLDQMAEAVGRFAELGVDAISGQVRDEESLDKMGAALPSLRVL